MGIIEIRAKKVFAGPGTSWIAEALAEDGDGSKVFATVHYYDGEEYTVSRESIYDFLTDEDNESEPAAEFLEEYDDYDDAADSEYIGVFDSLREVIEILG